MYIFLVVAQLGGGGKVSVLFKIKPTEKKTDFPDSHMIVGKDILITHF